MLTPNVILGACGMVAGGWKTKGDAYYATYANTNGVSARGACCGCGKGQGTDMLLLCA